MSNEKTNGAWHLLEDVILENKRYECFSPIYPVGDSMRHRILDGEFIPKCKEVTHVRELTEPVIDNEVKLFYQIKSNEDTSYTMPDLSDCIAIIKSDMEGRPKSEIEELEFTISPVFMTNEEYSNLDEY